MIRNLVATAFALGLMASTAHASTVLVTGTNRGIGLELVKAYAAKGWDVIATARNPEKADELLAVAKKNKKVVVEKLDVTDVKAIEALAAKYKGKPVDVLINNAGTLGDVSKQTIGALDQAEFINVLSANTFGALKVTEAFKSNLAAGQMKKAFAMTSGLGSSELTARRGGFYAYRMSKAALNIGFRALAADWKADGIMVGIIAPGMVETDLLRASNFPGKGISTEESVTGMMKVIEGMTFENNAKAINYNGDAIPLVTDAAIMHVEIKTIPDAHVAYMRHVGPYGHPGIPAMWQKFDAWCSANGLLHPRRTMYGVCQDSPDVTPPEKCRYDACVEVDAAFKPTGDIGVQTIPSGRFACTSFTGTAADIPGAWMNYFHHLMSTPGYALTGRPPLEIYPKDAKVEAAIGVFSCLLCAPVS